MQVMCEICHKKIATGRVWLTSDQTIIRVASRYQVCENHGGPKENKEKRDWGEHT